MKSTTQHRGRQAHEIPFEGTRRTFSSKGTRRKIKIKIKRKIKALQKTQRADIESLGLQHESRRGQSGARLGTRGTWISSLPSGVGSYAKFTHTRKPSVSSFVHFSTRGCPSRQKLGEKKRSPESAEKKVVAFTQRMCQRDRSTESTSEDIVGLCLACESLRRRDERADIKETPARDASSGHFFFFLSGFGYGVFVFPSGGPGVSSIAPFFAERARAGIRSSASRRFHPRPSRCVSRSAPRQ